MAALEPGARLGPSVIVAPLGVGGMGAGHRARDGRPGREAGRSDVAGPFDIFDRLTAGGSATPAARAGGPARCTWRRG
jgi:hypothetical protein